MDLQRFKKSTLSSATLEHNIHQNIGAVDSTFPFQIKRIFEDILSKIKNYQEEQYTATLNPSNEGTYDQNLPIGDLLDSEIALLEKYCDSSRALIMKYQLVIQLPEKLYGDLNWIADLEDRLDESIVDAEIDGHDIGSGEVNIFIHSNNPAEVFHAAKNILIDDCVELKNIKAAYREIGEDDYIPLWPENLMDFNQ